MQCAQCGNDLADDMRFCANCGRARDGQIAKPTVVMTKALKDATAYGSGLITDIRGLPFNTLFPFRSWAQSKIWSGTIVRAILFFALTPLVLSYYFGQDVSVKQAAWALGVYFALPGRARNIWLLGLGRFLDRTSAARACPLHRRHRPLHRYHRHPGRLDRAEVADYQQPVQRDRLWRRRIVVRLRIRRRRARRNRQALADPISGL